MDTRLRRLLARVVRWTSGERKSRVVESARDLTHAAAIGDVQQILRFIERGDDVNALDQDGISNPLHAAIENEHLPCIQTLVERGANIEFPLGTMTPLEHAVDISIDGTTQTGGSAGDEPMEIIEYLIRAGANIESGLKTARRYGSHKIIRLLEDRIARR